ncbi:MAG: fibrillarin-like rRNA/tRNA 2'-O-methyltransferase [Candidatus Hydrothermarchaeaceae archaeon]
MKKLFDGVYLLDDKLGTKNLVPGEEVYGEKLVQENGVEYRLWNPYRSKLAAAVLNGLKELPIHRNSKVFYIGAASGTTASHISDIASGGVVFCVEFSPRVFVKLLNVCATRKNMVPVFGDARQPHEYSMWAEKCDVMYQDVAQLAQIEILEENAKYYLKKGGSVLLVIKARSIDVSRKPDEVFNREIEKLKNLGFKIQEKIKLEPYDRDHVLVRCLK